MAELREPGRLTVTTSDAAPVHALLAGRSLDHPRPGAVDDDALLVGWVLGSAERCRRVIAIGDGRQLGHVLADRHRPDIENAFPDVPHAGQSGFRLRLHRQLLADVAEVELFAELESGERAKFWTLHLAPAPPSRSAPSSTPAATSPTGASAILNQLAQRLRSGGGLSASAATNGATTNGATTNGAATNGAATNGAATNGAATNGATTNGEQHAAHTAPLNESRRDDFRVVALMSAYNEADILGPVLEHLAANDIESYLIDDGSTDGTVEVAEAWLGRGLIGIEHIERAAEARTSWREILRRKQVLARELGADWYIHHDADEIRESPWPLGSLRDAIAWVDRLGYNAIDFRVLQFWPVDDTFGAGDDPRTHFVRWTNPAEYDVAQRKAWKAGYPDTTLEDGGHDVRFTGRRLFPVRFLVRHYPIRGQTHGLRKVLRERKARFAEEEIEYGWHRQYDDVSGPDHMFLRSPASLQEFDLEAIRLEELLNAGRAAAQGAHGGDSELDAGAESAGRSPARGVLEQVTPSMISGWAAREDSTGEPITVDLWDGGRQFATLRADQARPDLGEHGLDGGGFRLRPPSSLLDGRPHWIWATVSDTGDLLRGAPIVLHSGGRLKIASDVPTTVD